MYNDYEDKTLKVYCHYPLLLARQELENSHNDMYRIVTINWTVARNENLEIVDYEHVHKNIYEMTLGEFFLWSRKMKEVAEDVILIEKIYVKGKWK